MSTPIPIFDPEDPKLTAYALGELTDPAERAEVELLLQHSPQAQLTMKEIQDLTKDLAAEYDQERLAADTPVGVAERPPNVVDVSDRLHGRRWTWVRPLLAAAAVLLLVGSVAWLSLPVFSSVQVKSSRPVQFAGAPQTPAETIPNPASPVSDKDHSEPASTPATPGVMLAQNAPALRADDAAAGKKESSEQTLAPEALSEPLAKSRPLALQPPADPSKVLSPTNVRRAVVPSADTAALPAVPVVPGSGTFTMNPSTMSGMTGTTTGMGGGAGGGRPLAAASAQAKPDFDGFINYGSPIQTNEGNLLQAESRSVAISGRLAGAPGAAAPQAQPARVFRNGTDFYRAESGLKSKRAVDDLAKNNAYPETRARFLDQAALESDRSVPGKSEAPQEEAKPELWAKDKVIRREVPARPEFNTAAYDHLVENAFLGAKENPLSTFSIDVDTASYANVRRFIDGGSLPPPDAVRLEELINYFPYDYAPPAADSGKPFAVHLEAAACPWAPEHRLVRVGIKGKEIALDKRPASNLVFLLDVSGSMQPPERLPLVKQAMRMLTEQLTESDHVAIVTYAGSSGLVLPPTSGDHKDRILAALDNLNAGGSTNGASGITLAYKTAKEVFIKGGTNRVILATDGDFNVGVTNQGELVRMIQEQAKSGVFLSALGVGTDNFKDSTMQKLADKGNGNYNYIDRLEEARKVLVEQMSGTLLTIAKDVKIQVEFNPGEVSSYRLIGYEKRMLRKEDFNNDKIDAGEIGAGHSVTALYEVVPAGQPIPGEPPAVDSLKYGSKPTTAVKEERTAWNQNPHELLTLKMRFKAPDADTSERVTEETLVDKGEQNDYAKASPEFKFAAAVAAFGLTLRDSPYKGSATFGAAAELAQEGKGGDPKGYRSEFINLLRRAQTLKDARE